MRPRLFTPGPTQIPERVITAMSNPMIHHRSPEFRAILQDVTDKLREFFRTHHDVLLLTSSGTGGMEACVVNLLRRNDAVVTVEGGKFGQRWGELCRAYGVQVHSLEVPWGEAVDPDEVARVVRQHPDVAAVFVTHSETSTGVAFDVEHIARVVHENSEALVVVDGITSVGVLPFEMDAWGIDVCVSGSQKGTMIPPGLAFVALNDRAWAKAEQGDLPRYYFDFLKARKAQKAGNTPFTPAITLVYGLQESLSMILEKGLEYFWEKYARLAQATREGARAVGLELFAKRPSNALTAIKVPPGIDGLELVKILREKYGVTVAGGQEHLKGKIFRVAHMGYYDHLDMVAFASAMEMALRDLGWHFELGRAVSTVQIVYLNGVVERSVPA